MTVVIIKIQGSKQKLHISKNQEHALTGLVNILVFNGIQNAEKSFNLKTKRKKKKKKEKQPILVIRLENFVSTKTMLVQIHFPHSENFEFRTGQVLFLF